MVDKVVLIQKIQSQYHDLAALALAQAGLEAIGLQQAPSQGALVLWDLEGYQQDESEALVLALSEAKAGVVLLCEQVDDICRSVLDSCRCLGVVCAPQSAGALTAALILGKANLERLNQLEESRDSLIRQHQDRLLVEKAKRVLIEERGWQDAQAMSRMQRYARNNNLKLAQVAKRILEGQHLLNGGDK